MTRFDEYCRRKEAVAQRAHIPGFRTLEAAPDPGLRAIASRWTEARFDGPFYRSLPRHPDLPAISLVFVQSHDGNTVAPDPSVLGGGETDKHLVYEGLSRVDADAVMAGAATARGEMVFSTWHPELVALRLSLGHPRHPVQVVVTGGGDLPVERALLFGEPSLPVLLVTRSAVAPQLRDRLAAKPWVEVIDAGDPLSLTAAARALRSRGIETISAIGGRRTATALLAERLVQDVYLTTSTIEAGEPGTPFHEGPPLRTRRVMLKGGRGEEEGVRFEHLLLNHEGQDDPS